MKRIFIFLLFPFMGVNAQTKTTENLDKKYEGMSLFFYKNTLRMLNQQDNKEFDEMIKDIEKMRFVMIDKKKHVVPQWEYTSLKKNYRAEQYEEMMTARIDGRNFEILVKEQNGRVKGTIILASDSASLIVLDILGRIALEKARSLFTTIDQSTDVSKMVRNFVNGEKDKKTNNKEEGGVKAGVKENN
ncbi:MAG: DUF4252 domain-containing protein [Cytophagales bacterium]